jgi:hypothetical protein
MQFELEAHDKFINGEWEWVDMDTEISRRRQS